MSDDQEEKTIDSRVVHLFAGDQRCVALVDAIIELIYERGKGKSGPAIIGVLEICKAGMISKLLGQDQGDDNGP